MPASSVKQVDAYVRSVTSGKRVTGELERLAVERHAADLKRKDWPYHFDRKIAQVGLDFFPMVLRHSIGKWAGQPFRLQPWQAFCTASLFGWRHKETKARRFRKALVSVARKNGKTSWVAGMAALIAYSDVPPDPMAEIYFTACKQDQADIGFRMFRSMVEVSDVLGKRSRARHDRVVNRDWNTVIRPLSWGPSHGLNPSMIICDELHEWGEIHRDFLAALTTSGASRQQQLIVSITTAGDDNCELWLEEDDYARRVVEDGIDDTYFSFVCRLDADDDPFEERNWVKANPNLGESVSVDYLQNKVNEVKYKANARNEFIRFHCNRQTGSHEQPIERDAWDAAAKPGLEITLDGSWVGFLGVDLGRSYDWSAVTACFTPMPDDSEDDPPRCWHLMSWAWTCDGGKFAHLVKRSPFAEWRRDGWLTVHHGDTVNFAHIEEAVCELCDKYPIAGISFDPAGASDTATRVGMRTGLQTYEFFQTNKNYNEPVKRLLKELHDGNLTHDGNPCLAWQASNLTIKRDVSDRWMPDKGRNPDRKIDGMVAAIMAFERCLFEKPVPFRSYYADNEPESI